MDTLGLLNPVTVLVESFALDVPGAGLDEANWNQDPRVLALKEDLDSSNRRKKNNWQDALIAEVALLNGHVLVTADNDLANTAEKHGVQVVRIAA